MLCMCVYLSIYPSIVINSAIINVINQEQVMGPASIPTYCIEFQDRRARSYHHDQYVEWQHVQQSRRYS